MSNEQFVHLSSRYPFIAVHRGGPLKREEHRRLMRWARECSEHLLPLLKEVDQRLLYALQIAEEWENDRVSTGTAMKASLGAHAVAREASDPVLKAVARAIGQAVATAHMADHSMGAAIYGVQAVKHAGGSVTKERSWQIDKLQLLPPQIVEMVLATMQKKEEGFRKE